MNYIGSKLSLLAEIRTLLAGQQIAADSFCDLFSGTSIVAQMARVDGFRVLSNDLQAYSYVMQQAFLATDGYPGFARLLAALPAIASRPPTLTRPAFGLGPPPTAAAEPLIRVLGYLESLPPRQGPFYDAYCDGGSAGRSYFAADAGARCEAMRDALAAWHAADWIDDQEFYLLLASLIETMDQLANTASVYGAYLKQVKKSARQPLVLRVPRLVTGGGPHEPFQQDGLALVKTLASRGREGVLYLDPPYNQRQYHANYHVLETIARWDMTSFTPLGKTGLRPSTGYRSDFCSRRHVARAFGEILEAADFRHILVSYSNEGLLPQAELEALLLAKANGGRHEFKKVAYKRFRADLDGETRRYKGDAVEEFLFYIRPQSPDAR